MKKLVKKLLIISFLLTSACGFQVVYKENQTSSSDDISYVKELASIRIKKDRNRASQEFKNNLYDFINPTQVVVEPKYLLIANIKETKTATFITLTGASGRNRLIVDVDYTLQDLATAKVISKGSTSVYDNYDVDENRYGTYSAEAYVRSNLSKIAAQNIRNSLVNDLIEEKRNAEEEKSQKK